MKLIAGLGNPGREYVGTRHNVGFEVIDQLASRVGLTSSRNRFEGETLDGVIAGEKVLLLKPLTFMNLSGKAVQGAMAFYQLTPPDILVVLDDLALPCGKLRIRSGGSSGGHNGLKDIERALGTPQYPRLRLGIDASPPYMDAKDYVLARFTDDQRKLIDPAVARATDAVTMWIEKGLNPAMNVFNADEKKDE
jgi:PTH1 family peptidyl-tRNA hydrolase